VKNEVVFDNQSIESTSDNTLKTALHNFKKNFVIQILDSVSWNQTEAAKIMGIQRTYLSKLMSDLDIRK
jgi:Nif-specific regulatory protein